MFDWFKKKEKDRDAASKSTTSQKDIYNFKWFEIGKDNPFNKRILDVRSFTQTIISTTSDPAVATKFNELRKSVGDEYIGKDVAKGTKMSTTLRYQHNGAALQGVVFKSDSMDCKWDIYFYNDCFYFVRSWTGDLIYKALARITADAIYIDEIEYNIDPVDAVNNVHFLMISHAFGWAHPHNVPSKIINEKELATYSFNLFGNRACYACYDDITDTVMVQHPLA